jgi:replicative DNA helicase
LLINGSWTFFLVNIATCALVILFANSLIVVLSNALGRIMARAGTGSRAATFVRVLRLMRPYRARAIFMMTMAVDRNEPVAFFSLEMSKSQLVQRMLCSVARVNLKKMRTAKLTELDWNRLTSAANRLHEAPLFIDDTPAISVLELRAKARRLCKAEKIGLLVVDYLQLIRTSGRVESRQQEVSLISRSLKALAKELDIPVIALSQLSRAVESRTDQRPKLADLRESGAIEQDADLVIFIYRPEQAGIKMIEDRSTKGMAQVLLEKNRNGPTGLFDLLFIEEFTNFENLSLREEIEAR